MSRPDEVAAQLDAAIHGLEEVRRIVSEGGRATFDASEDRSRALAFCWVSTGSALKHYAHMIGAPQGAPPLSGHLYGFGIASPINVSTSWTSSSSGKPARETRQYCSGS